MEIIAVTVWNDIISPLYDAACNLVIVRPDAVRRVRDIRNASLMERAEICRSEGVNVLICGAISSIAALLLTERGVTVVSWIRGGIDEVLDAYRADGLSKQSYCMPGSCPRRCRKGRGPGCASGTGPRRLSVRTSTQERTE